MAYIVTENCHKCRFTDCVTVCPVDCFHGDAEMLYIDPNECIDCGACEPACPVKAIFDESSVPENMKSWIAVNSERAAGLPVVSKQEASYPGAEERKASLGF